MFLLWLATVIIFDFIVWLSIAKTDKCLPLLQFLLKGNGNPLQYSCLENPMDGEAAPLHGVTKSRTQLSDDTFVKGDQC